MAPHSEANGAGSRCAIGATTGEKGVDPSFDGSALQNKARSGSTEAAAGGWWVIREHSPPTSVERLCPLLWQTWVVGLVAGSILLLDAHILVYAGFITAAFLGTAFIPDSGDSPAPYFLHLAVPFFAIKGLREGGAWTLINFYWAFVLLPLADIVVGVDTFNKRDEEYKHLRERGGFRVATWIFVPAQLTLIAYACHAVNTVDLTGLEFAGFAVSVGIYTGGLGVTISHELVHKSNRLEQWLGRLVCVTMSYGHFFVEHNRGHHRLVGTDDDPATARFNEPFYSFLPRCVVGSFISAWRLEEDRCRERNLPRWHNEMLWYWAVSAFLCALLTVAFGPKSIPMFLGQSVVGIILFESVNYLEHYGLERGRGEDNRLEPVWYEHSWDAPHRLTNMVLFKLQRHGDHHVNSTRRYQILRAEPSRSPQLPMGYSACILLALCPPLWRAVMNPRVLRLRSKYKGREWRHGPGA